MRTEAILLAAAAAACLAACGGNGQTCGASQPAAGSAELVSYAGGVFTYGDFHAALAGDCPVEVGSRGSVTITGRQTVTDFPLTFCVRRENDVVSGEAIALDDDTFIQVVDVSAKDAAGCTYGKDISAAPTGTITFDGFCTAAGTEFNLVLAGAIGGVKTCAGASEAVTLTLAGSVRVIMDDSTQ